MNLIIDFEYTGLDNQYIIDNEIIQLKIHHVETNKNYVFNYSAKKPMTAGAYIKCPIKIQKTNPLFSIHRQSVLGLIPC